MPFQKDPILRFWVKAFLSQNIFFLGIHWPIFGDIFSGISPIRELCLIPFPVLPLIFSRTESPKTYFGSWNSMFNVERKKMFFSLCLFMIATGHFQIRWTIQKWCISEFEKIRIHLLDDQMTNLTKKMVGSASNLQ